MWKRIAAVGCVMTIGLGACSASDREVAKGSGGAGGAVGGGGQPSGGGGFAGTGGSVGGQPSGGGGTPAGGGSGGTGASGGSAGAAGGGGAGGASGGAPNDAGTSACPQSTTYTCTAGVATDPLTSLSWVRSVGGGKSYSQAVSYCSGLTTEGSGWRLPTKDELMSLYKPTQNPPYDLAAFPGVPNPADFWSKTGPCGTASSKWVVDFAYANGGQKCYDTQYITSVNARCVRP